jgi:hypothetical protein
MISREIAVVDVHPEHWTNFIRGPLEKPPAEGNGWLVLVHHDNRVIHAVLGGKPLPELLGQSVDDLAALRHSFQASRVVCLEKDFMRRTHTRFDSGLSYDMDYVEQLLTMVAAFRKERGSGLRVDPPTPPGPVPPFSLVQFLFNRLWPDNTSIVLYVIDEEKESIWTSLILRKRRGDLDLLTTDLHLGDSGLAPMDWRADRLRLLSDLSARVAPPYLAFFSKRDAWAGWLATPFRTDAPRNDLVVEPFPRRLAVLSTLIRLLTRLRRA